MSSIFSSFKNITSDTQWFIKLCIMTVPVFLLMNYFLDANRVFNPHVIPFLIAVLVVYTGCGAFMINRYINNTFPILPDLVGIPELLFHSIFSVLVMAPGLSLCLATMYLISTNLFLEMKIMMGIYGLVLIFFLPFIFIPLTLYAMNGNIKDALNLKPLGNGAGNFIIAMFAFVIQYAFTVFLVWLIFYIIFSKMMKDPYLINAINSFFIVYTFIIFFSYLADQFGDSIPDPRSAEEVYGDQ